MHDYKIQILEAYIENPSEASEAFKRLATFGKIACFYTIIFRSFQLEGLQKNSESIDTPFGT
ncbi:MAG: hypothetical protein IPM48_09215 [Saprospiraceae bacterium]|nr:hypothetical protein [Saprospiraceae bacterium]